jgi:hypothetical protein
MLQTWGWREWDNATLAVVVKAFGERFPEHNVRCTFLCVRLTVHPLCLQIVALNSNAINTPDYCLACEVMAYSKADIMVGVHGAGRSIRSYTSLNIVSC